MFRLITAIWVPTIVIAIALFLNGALDTSNERIAVMKIDTSRPDPEDTSLTEITVTDGDRQRSYSLHHTPAAVGDQQKVGWRAGKFGWEWESTEPLLIPQPH